MIKYSDKFKYQIDNWEKLYNDAKNNIDNQKDKKGVLIVIENNNLNFIEEKNKLVNELVEKCIKEGKKPCVISPFDFDIKTNYENNVIKLFQTGTLLDGEKINFSEILLVSQPETCIDSMMKFIKGGVVPLIYTVPERGKTPNFCSECVRLLKKVSEQDNDWVRNNHGDVLDTWNEKWVQAKTNMENAYSIKNYGKPRKILIECAAQHPLKMGVLPGEEFKARLDKAIQLYKEEKAKGNDVQIYIPGSLHRVEKNENSQRQVIQDLIPLSKSGAFYLERNGIPIEDIFSEEKNKELMPQGVYNSADECRVASQIFKDGQYNELLSIVSPGQMLRCGLFYLTFGCVPSFYTAPTKESFHNPVSELTHAIPNVLIESPSWQLKLSFGNATEKDDEIARNTRSSRNPILLPSPEQIIER